MRYTFLTAIFCFLTISTSFAQNLVIEDDFEGNGTITTWFGDDCNINTAADNPYPQGINTSDKVLEYQDVGGQYANIRFQISENFDLSVQNTFTLKVYVPSSGISGNQNNQISLKLQDGTQESPWMTQTEVVKSVTLNQWQIVSFNFETDPFINLDPNSPLPVQRTDLNRVVIQINGENNNDLVTAYIDDLSYGNTEDDSPVFDFLVWSDEFDGNGAINTNKWFHQTQLPAGNTWFNGEIQHYTDRIENSFEENGNLNLVARKETFTDQGVTKQHTSARLNSKFAFQYGRVEVRAKLPSGAGTWPAIWTLGQNINEDGAYWENQGFGNTSWPACGEMDIMEHWGTNQNYISSATHTPSSFGNTINVGGQILSDASTDFNVYTLEWTPEKLVFSVDGAVHFTYNPENKNPETWPFDAPQYILLNVAILPSISPNFTESAMEIDYVRVYQESPLSDLSLDDDLEIATYPNPFDTELFIEASQFAGQDVTAQIYTLDGKLVHAYSGAMDGAIFKLSNLGFLSKGIYLVHLRAKKQHFALKVVKE